MESMKRYLVFGGAAYYPGGGWSDFVGAFDSLEEAQKTVLERTAGRPLERKLDWTQIVDLVFMDEVKEYGPERPPLSAEDKEKFQQALLNIQELLLRRPDFADKDLTFDPGGLT